MESIVLRPVSGTQPCERKFISAAIAGRLQDPQRFPRIQTAITFRSGIRQKEGQSIAQKFGGVEKYEIERIIDHDYKYGNQWYKISWKGYSEIYESTWEPREELIKDAKKLILDYEKTNKIGISRKGKKRNQK